MVIRLTLQMGISAYGSSKAAVNFLAAKFHQEHPDLGG